MRGVDGAAAMLAPGTWAIDRERSSVEFVAQHLIGKVKGRFSRFDGVIHVEAEPSRSSVAVMIDAASINTDHRRRDIHLRSADFLDVARFPTLSYRSTRVTAVDGAGGFRLEGELSVRDVTRPVVLDGEYLGAVSEPGGSTRCAFSAVTAIDRHDFGVRWHDLLDSGGIVLGNGIEITLDVQAILR